MIKCRRKDAPGFNGKAATHDLPGHERLLLVLLHKFPGETESIAADTLLGHHLSDLLGRPSNLDLCHDRVLAQGHEVSR